MRRLWIAVLLAGLGAAGLSGCYVVQPEVGPAYAPPYPPPYPPPPAGPPPGPAGPPASGCPSVTVEGHHEVHVRPGGERETVWVPTQVVPMCR